ncbi:MAG: cell division protein FtsQ/DivIB [Pseudomonadota bacterium]
MRPLGPAIRPGKRPEKPDDRAPMRRAKSWTFFPFRQSKPNTERKEPPVMSAPVPPPAAEAPDQRQGLLKKIVARLGDLKLRRRRGRTPSKDPAPSRAKYRWDRLMLRPRARKAILNGVPAVLFVLIAVAIGSNPGLRAQIGTTYQKIRDDVVSRPELFVQVIEVTGASPRVDRQIRLTSGLSLPMSSFDLDLEAFRARLEGLDAVRSASVYLRAGGVLHVHVEERVPVLLWRGPTGLEAVDIDGVRTAYVDRRSAFPGLPLIAGAGATDDIEEALHLYRQLRPIAHRIRALSRIGARRWDIVLSDGPLVKLPAEKPGRGVTRILALHSSDDIFELDLAAIDLRNPDQTIVQRRPATPETGAVYTLSGTQAEGN